ncbi:CD3337/EF1877 family mobilome membrane protein, partial [Enterococcus faecalis]
KMLFGANGTDFLKMMTNMFFSLSKLIWQGLDFVIEKLYEGAAMNELIHQFLTFSDTIYSKIYDPIGAGIVVLYVLY